METSILDKLIETVNPNESDLYFFYMNQETYNKVFGGVQKDEYKGYPVTIHDCEDDCVYFTSENEILKKVQKEIQKRMEEECERMMFPDPIDNELQGLINNSND